MALTNSEKSRLRVLLERYRLDVSSKKATQKVASQPVIEFVEFIEDCGIPDGYVHKSVYEANWRKRTEEFNQLATLLHKAELQAQGNECVMAQRVFSGDDESLKYEILAQAVEWIASKRPAK